MCQPSDPTDLPASTPPRRPEGVLIGLLAVLILLQGAVLLTTLTG